MKVDVKHDLATLTTINELAINRLFSKINWCVCDAVEKAMLNDESEVELDLGFGTLLLRIEQNNVIYKFKPSKNLEKSVINTAVYGSNELVLNIESGLVAKISNIYKGMF